MPAIETDNLKKSYVTSRKEPGFAGSLQAIFRPNKVEVDAVKGIDLVIEQGEIVGFLGPNGAGKTTTLKMLSGILFPSGGEAKVLGFEPWKRDRKMLRQISLVMGNKMQLWWDLPAWDSFVVLKELYEVDDITFKRRVDHLIDTLGLEGKINTQVRKLSLGERMKCELVAALLHGPQVVFLDEPTLGLDVVSQKRIRLFLKELHAEENCTILLTSHYMQDVQELCQRVVVIDHGSVIFSGTLDTLAEQFSDSRRIKLSFIEPVSRDSLDGLGTIVEFDGDSAVVRVARADTASVAATALQKLPVQDVSIDDVEIEDVIRKLFERTS